MTFSLYIKLLIVTKDDVRQSFILFSLLHATNICNATFPRDIIVAVQAFLIYIFCSVSKVINSTFLEYLIDIRDGMSTSTTKKSNSSVN